MSGEESLETVGDALRRPADRTAALVTASGPQWAARPERSVVNARLSRSVIERSQVSQRPKAAKSVQAFAAHVASGRMTRRSLRRLQQYRSQMTEQQAGQFDTLLSQARGLPQVAAMLRPLMRLVTGRPLKQNDQHMLDMLNEYTRR